MMIDLENESLKISFRVMLGKMNDNLGNLGLALGRNILALETTLGRV